jgi:hypothetical protein
VQCTVVTAASRVPGWIAGCTLLVGGAFAMAPAMAQAPVVPVDHYGPPVCGVGKASAHRMTPEKAKAEEELGARDERMLPATEPGENFGIERYRIAAYAECVGDGGCYWADLDAQYKRAEAALKARVAAAKAGEKLAVVMDIDETTLSSYCEMQREDYGYVGSMWNAWVVTPEAAVAIPGALRFFHEAKKDGVAVFFITGRPGMQEAKSSQTDQTAATAKNLEAAGFRGWAGLRLRNGAENTAATISYKSEERGKIAKEYSIVVSVGDQWSDLLGEPQAAVSVKLPNPFYFLP